MGIEEAALLAALRGDRSVDDVCRAAGVTAAEFEAARAADLKRRLPPADARLRAAVRGPVEILRDGAGVPHVYAQTTGDLYFGLGFAMAQDRLWQIDRLRRRALGRQAEVLGPAYAASDLVHLTVGIDRIAAAEAERLDDATRSLVEAFVAGLNRQIEACGDTLPIEFSLLDYAPRPFTAADVVAILRGMWWSLNGRLETLAVAEAARLLASETLRAAYLTPEAPEERIVPAGTPYPPAGLPLDTLHDALDGRSSDPGDAADGRRTPVYGGTAVGRPPSAVAEGSGSNNWAVAGRRTATGHAILCSDPHQAFWLPSSWYEFAVHGPEDSAAGAGHPGVPGIWSGTNGDVAWGITNNAASTRDLYREQVHLEDPSRYRDGDAWRVFDERAVEIPVRGEAPRRFTVRSTVRGPIVNECLPAVAAVAAEVAKVETPSGHTAAAPAGVGPPLSLRWVGQEHLDDVRALVAVGRARDWPAFRAALQGWTVPVFNFGYADRKGQIGYQCAGRVPVRARGWPGFREANNPADAWQGYVPFDALPRLEDPPRGYVASANNRVAPDDYPYPFYGAWAAGHRAARLRQALEGTGTVDRAQMVALQNDVKSCRAERLCPPLLRRLAGLAASDDPDLRLLHEALQAWDCRYDLGSRAPVLFEAFVHAWQRRVAAERFPARLVPLVQAQGSAAARLLATDDLPWFAGGPMAAALLQTAKEAVAEVRARFGADPAAWRWGAVHQAYWRHPLSTPAAGPAFDVGPAPVDGGADTVRNTGVSPEFGASSGAEYRLVVDFADPARCWAVQNAGNSGQPGSPHYADQFGPWRAGAYHTVHLDRAGVEADLEGATVLEPPEG